MWSTRVKEEREGMKGHVDKSMGIVTLIVEYIETLGKVNLT